MIMCTSKCPSWHNHPGWLDPVYKPHYVCFECRKHFKLRFDHDDDDELELPKERLCPQCRLVMTRVCTYCFKPPPRSKIKLWQKIREHYYGKG